MTEPLIAVPSREIQDKFESSVRPLRGTMKALIRMNAQLGVITDLLLPKLVTGQIDVSKLDLGALVDSVA